MTSTEKKPRLISLNPNLSNRELIEKFQKSYVERKPFSDSVIHLEHQPFSHCTIDNFLLDQQYDQFCSKLINELKNIKLNEKNNDLYKFRQSDDLANVTLPCIEQFKQYLYDDFKNWLIDATNIRLTDKIDMTSSKYEYSDYLLCHDDDIHGTVEGRRIAFIYYLVSEDWDEKDGGALDLFETDDQLQPVRIVRSLVPKRNRLAFFEVNDKSFHQVSEVLSKEKGARLSINGWLHGPVNFRPEVADEVLPEMKTASKFQKLDLDRVNQTISSIYLDVTTQYDVQSGFQDNSETKLSNFFQEDFHSALLKDLQSDQIQWKRRGPYNKRNFEVAEISSIPAALKNLVELFGSEPMFAILGSLTGLTSENDDEDQDEDEESSYEPSTKKRKSSQEKNVAGSSSGSCSARWYFEIRRWKQSYYSLSFDQQNSNENPEENGALDVMIFFNYPKDQSEETTAGGDVVYTLKNEDETLLRVVPDENSLNLVYREDGNVMKFNKYVNDRLNGRTFYEFFACYVDLEKFRVD